MAAMFSRPIVFRDRTEAGERLGSELSQYQSDGIVLAIPNGGVPVGIAAARKQGMPLDLVIPRKIPVPGEPEAGYGAVTDDGTIVVNDQMVHRLKLSANEIRAQAAAVQTEIVRRSRLYRDILPEQNITGKVAIITDDGLASGYTMLAAVNAVKGRRPAQVIVAVPVASGQAYDLIRSAANGVIAVIISNSYPFAVASFYRQWADLDDKSVMAYLKEWQEERKRQSRHVPVRSSNQP